MPITPGLNKKMHMLITSLAGPSLGPDITCSMFTLSKSSCSLRLALGSAGSVSMNSLTYVSCFQIASALQETLHAHLALFLHAQVRVRACSLYECFLCTSQQPRGIHTQACAHLKIQLLGHPCDFFLVTLHNDVCGCLIIGGHHFHLHKYCPVKLDAYNRGGQLAAHSPMATQL